MKKNVLSLLLAIPILIVFTMSKCDNTETAAFRDEATENLFQNLRVMSTQNKIMFGVANPTSIMYKERHIYEGFETSDIKEITGQNPAFYESDFMWFDNDSLIAPDKEAMRKAYERGAVVGYCWHLRGPESNSFYSRVNNRFSADKNLVKDILAGGSREENRALDWLLTELDTMVIPTFKELAFPLVFRPWHEMNGGWFWWGKDNCTPDELVQLFQLTVDYIRDSGVRNVLYCWSPDTYFLKEYYPGDEYVDILGLDIYEMGAVDYKPIELVVAELEKLTDYADSVGKVAAITETGLRIDNGVFRYPEVNPYYWSQNILEPIINNEKLKRLVWVLSWYSSDWSQYRKSQVYYPYVGMENDFERGQDAIDDFLLFFNHEATLFEDDLPDMYNKPQVN